MHMVVIHQANGGDLDVEQLKSDLAEPLKLDLAIRIEEVEPAHVPHAFGFPLGGARREFSDVVAHDPLPLTKINIDMLSRYRLSR